MLTAPTHAEVDVLIPEARRRQRRRRTGLAVVVALVLIATVVIGLSHHGKNAVPTPFTVPPDGHPPAAVNARSLNRPAALAVGVGGLLYIADDSRNVIFARHPDGRFAVVAGTGVKGFSGDGGPANRARLNDPAGLTYDAATQTLYVADSGNNRVRAINSRGIIRTVIGGGRHHGDWVRTGTPATQADFEGPVAVTISPAGELFATNGQEVVRLAHGGRLVHVAGTRTGPQGNVGDGRPAVNASIDGADGLAFDGRGDLFLAGENTKAMLAITPAGTMQYLCPYCLYPRGDAGLIAAPDGGVLAMAPLQIYRYDGLHHRRLFVNLGQIGRVDGISGLSPAGIAVTRNGAIYIDTDDRAGYASATAILEIPPGRRPHVIWRRP